MTPSTVTRFPVSRRSFIMSGVAAGSALAVMPISKLTAGTPFVQDLKIPQPRITVFSDDSGLAKSPLPTLQLIEAYAVEADLVVVSISDEKRFRFFNRSLGEAVNIARRHQSHVLVLSESPEVPDSFARHRLIGPQGLISPFLDKLDIVAWPTELGVIASTNSEQSAELGRHFSTGFRPDLIVCHDGLRDGLRDSFHEDIDHASVAYRVILQDIDNKGPKILAPNGQILTQAAPGFMQGVTAKIDVMAVRQARERPDSTRI